MTMQLLLKLMKLLEVCITRQIKLAMKIEFKTNIKIDHTRHKDFESFKECRALLFKVADICP